MINLEIFLLGLMIVSVLTSLTTEAIKKIMIENKGKKYANTIAGVVAALLSAFVGSGYIIFNNITFTSQIVIYIVALVFMSWLCAMVGYDKVIEQIKKFKESDN